MDATGKMLCDTWSPDKMMGLCYITKQELNYILIWCSRRTYGL